MKDQKKMDKTMDINPGLNKQTRNWTSSSKQSGKVHNLYKRIADSPDYLHEEVMNVITNRNPGRI
jgi:hypothetical protein